MLLILVMGLARLTFDVHAQELAPTVSELAQMYQIIHEGRLRSLGNFRDSIIAPRLRKASPSTSSSFTSTVIHILPKNFPEALYSLSGSSMLSLNLGSFM